VLSSTFYSRLIAAAEPTPPRKVHERLSGFSRWMVGVFLLCPLVFPAAGSYFVFLGVSVQ
jgi:hypothetical protein